MGDSVCVSWEKSVAVPSNVAKRPPRDRSYALLTCSVYPSAIDIYRGIEIYKIRSSSQHFVPPSHLILLLLFCIGYPRIGRPREASLSLTVDRALELLAADLAVEVADAGLLVELDDDGSFVVAEEACEDGGEGIVLVGESSRLALRLCQRKQRYAMRIEGSDVDPGMVVVVGLRIGM